MTLDGAVVTNAHVVKDCSAIRVTTGQGATAVAKIVAHDERNDLALLGTGLTAKKTAAFRTSIRLGETVEAFGYPLTEVLAKSGNFTLGNVSALVGLGEDSRYLQISAPVQPGNSGGPLLDQNGNLVGVVSAKLNALKLMLVTQGDIAQNVNFAIKASIVMSFLDANGVGTLPALRTSRCSRRMWRTRPKPSAYLSSASRASTRAPFILRLRFRNDTAV